MYNFKKIFGLAGAVMIFTGLAYGQATCSNPVSGAVLIRAEGTAELTADLSFTCTATASATANVIVFSSLPITSKALTAGSTTASEAVASITVGATTTSVQGTVSGTQVTFSGVTIPTGTNTVVISNIRVNATSLSVTTGTPPAVTESAFISGAGVTAAALAATPVAYALPGLTGIKAGTGASATLNPATCAATSAGAASFTVQFGENFPTAFKTQGGSSNSTPGSPFTNNTETGFVPSSFSLTPGASNAANSATRVKVVFANIPGSVSIYVPTTLTSGTTGVLTLTSSETGAFSAVSATAPTSGSSGNGLPSGTGAPALAQLTASSNSATAIYEVTGQSASATEAYAVAVYLGAAANSITSVGNAITAQVSLAPNTGAASNIPAFQAPATPVSVTGSSFTLCSTSLLFPFVTSQSGFDTGVAISNTSMDPFGTTKGAPNQAGTCQLNFYGAGAPTTPNTVSPNIPSGTTYATVLSSVAPGFTGYIIAQCNFQFAHGFAFVEFGLGTTSGLSQGYLALVLPTPGSRTASSTSAEALAQ